mgnify:CR=1 FL=1
MRIEERIGILLKERSLKLALAESCTGGLVGHRITNIPGSSDYYQGSVTAYAYEAKRKILGVNPQTLLEFGAVSRETVLEMACGVRAAFSGDETPIDQIVGVSISGIAGPGGGMPGKPVGLVWVGLLSNARGGYPGSARAIERAKPRAARRFVEDQCQQPACGRTLLCPSFDRPG